MTEDIGLGTVILLGIVIWLVSLGVGILGEIGKALHGLLRPKRKRN